MNSLNVRQLDGGNIIKQADSGSLFKFELLDENYKKFETSLLGETATVILKQGPVAFFKKVVPLSDSSVSFNLDKILAVGDYVLEIIVGNYVFPSSNRVIITVEQTYGDFQPEYLVKVSYEELKADVDEWKAKVKQLENTVDQNGNNFNQELIAIGQNSAEMIKRIESLESREDKDTIYDDSEIRNRLKSLEAKEDKDTIYDDTELRNRVVVLENKPDNDTIYDDTEIKQKIAEIEANAPAVHLAYADSEDGSVGFTKFKPPIVLNTTFLNTTKRFVGMSVKDSNDYRDYVWLANPELAKNWQYYELASTILDDCKKEISTLYSFNSAVARINNVVGAVIVKEDPYITLMQKDTDTNNILQFDTANIGDALFSFIAEQNGQFDNDWYLFDANNNKTYIHSGLNIIFAKPKMIGKDGDIVNPLKIRNTLCCGTGGLTFNFTLTQDEIIKIVTLAHNTYIQKFTLYQKIMNGIVLYAYPQGSVVLMQNDTSPNGLLKRGVWSKLGEIALTNPDGKLYAYVRVV